MRAALTHASYHAPAVVSQILSLQSEIRHPSFSASHRRALHLSKIYLPSSYMGKINARPHWRAHQTVIAKVLLMRVVVSMWGYASLQLQGVVIFVLDLMDDVAGNHVGTLRNGVDRHRAYCVLKGGIFSIVHSGRRVRGEPCAS